MKKKNIFAMKFAVVAIAIGVMSPSVNVEKVTAVENAAGAENSYVLNVSLLNTAEARPVHRQARRVSRRTSRRTTRRNVAYRGGGGRYYGGGSYYNNTGAAVVGGMVVGAAVATAANSSRRY